MLHFWVCETYIGPARAGGGDFQNLHFNHFQNVCYIFGVPPPLRQWGWLQCCLSIKFKDCFRDLLIRGACSAATAPRLLQEKKKPKHGKGKCNRVVKEVLFEFACAQDSNLGKVGAEHDVPIIQDRFSKVIQAYPSVSRDAAQVASSFKHFVGLRSSEFKMVKSDAAGVILKAVVEQGWLSEASVPSRFPHNLHLAAEKALRDLEDHRRVELLDIESLPIRFVDHAPEAKHKSRRLYITYKRMLEIGAAPGCTSCDNDTSSHWKECTERFERAFGKADESGDVVEPASH